MSACATQSYVGIVEEIERAANGANTSELPYMTGCGHAGTFDLNASEPAFEFAVVRDPISRFISALSPHSSDISAKAAGYLYHKMDFPRLDHRVFGVVLNENTSVLEMLVRRAARIRSQGEYIDDAHVRSQSYFLASTDAAGQPIRWDAIVRLEEARNFSQQLARAMLRDAGLDRDARGQKWAATALFSSDQNSKRYGPAGAKLRAEVLSHPTLARIGAARGRSPAQVALRWAVQRDVLPVPHASSAARLRENLEGALGFELSADELALVDAMDAGERVSFDPKLIA